MVPVMPAQAGIRDFGGIDPQAVDGPSPAMTVRARLWVTLKGRWYNAADCKTLRIFLDRIEQP
jgi:hypothetical protein